MSRNRRRMACSVLLGAALCGSALAEPAWICAITGVTACQDDGKTGAPDLGSLARPTFLRVDLDAKTVTILAPASRRGEVSAIASVHKGEKSQLLTGIERGRAWTLLITEEGNMTMALTDDGEVWSVFGSAIREEDLKPAEKATGSRPAAK